MKSKPIKLAVLLQDLEFGGTQRYAVNLLTHIDRSIFDPELWTFRSGTDMLPAAERAGVKVVFLTQRMSVGPRAVASLWAQLRRARPDILYTLTVLPNRWGRLLGWLSGVPVIVSSYRNRIARQHDKLLWPLSAKIICNAQSLKDLLIERFNIDPQRLEVIPNGVDTDHFKPDPEARPIEPTVLYLGRLVPQKDPLLLLEAFRLASERVPEARLVMVGNGELREEAERFIESHGMGDRVTLREGARDVRPFLRSASVFAMSSLFEGSPNVMLEAMASGLPIVSPTVDGVPELVDQGVTGLLTRRRDPAALAEGIASLLTDPDAARAMGARAREKVLAGHSMTDMVRRTERVFLECFRPGQ